MSLDQQAPVNGQDPDLTQQIFLENNEKFKAELQELLDKYNLVFVPVLNTTPGGIIPSVVTMTKDEAKQRGLI